MSTLLVLVPYYYKHYDTNHWGKNDINGLHQYNHVETNSMPLRLTLQLDLIESLSIKFSPQYAVQLFGIYRSVLTHRKKLRWWRWNLTVNGFNEALVGFYWRMATTDVFLIHPFWNQTSNVSYTANFCTGIFMIFVATVSTIGNALIIYCYWR